MTVKQKVLAAEGAQHAGAKVVVACKLPHGVVLRGFKMEEYDEPVLGGGLRSVKRAVEIGERVVVFGNAVPFGQSPKTRIVAGYALTDGVDRDVWVAWLADNKNSDMVKNVLIFACDDIASAEARARTLSKIRSGMEPLDPAGDPRRPKSLNPNVKDIGVDDRPQPAG